MIIPLLLMMITLAGCETGQSVRGDGMAPHEQCAQFWPERDPEIVLPRAIRRVQPNPVRHGPLDSLVCTAVLVDVEGRVVDTELRYTNDQPFAHNVEAALKRWRFEPGTRDGAPVETLTLITTTLRSR